MKTFEIGKTYIMRSPCDHECVWSYKVTKRTNCTITIVDEYGKEKKCRVGNYKNIEYVYPLGNYSMCPILRAS